MPAKQGRDSATPVAGPQNAARNSACEGPEEVCDIPPLPTSGHPTSSLLRGSAADLSYYLETYEQSVTARANGRSFIKVLRDRADELDLPKRKKRSTKWRAALGK
jgi:hypothetical protein